jgi:hypothetical protein
VTRPTWRSRPLAVYLGLVAFLVVVKLVLTFLPGLFRSPAQAAVFEWRFLALWTVLGSLGVLLSERTGFPDPLDERIGPRERYGVPAAIGAGLGALAIATDATTHWTRFVAAKMHLPTIHVEFPASVLVYTGGAVIVEVIYRLFTIPLLMFVISNLLLRGKGQERTFWILAVPLSSVEALGDLGLRELGVGTMAAVFAQDYALNLVQAWVFRRTGFLAAILVRVAFYLIWHVLWGLVPA